MTECSDICALMHDISGSCIAFGKALTTYSASGIFPIHYTVLIQSGTSFAHTFGFIPRKTWRDILSEPLSLTPEKGLLINSTQPTINYQQLNK